jgi:hypothetical protein
MKRDTLVLLAVLPALTVALGTIGWWFGSLEGVRKMGQALMMLSGAIFAVQHCFRWPKGSPMTLCGAILGLGVPFLVRDHGPMYVTILALSVAGAWIVITIGRSQPPARPRLRRKQA